MDTHKTLTWIGALAMIVLFGIAAGSAHAVETPRSLRAAEGFATDRDEDLRHDMSKAEVREAAQDATKVQRTVMAHSAGCCGHYVYSGFTELFDDIDRDGYFTYLRINVDVDTDYFESDVYLKAFLRGSYGDWHKIYTSNVFTINGTSSFDDYEIETELISGFSPDYYDVLVEVYEAHSGKLLVEYGALENSSFSLRPLEDINRDGAITRPIVDSYGSSGGGSTSWIALVLLSLLAVTRHRRRPSGSGRL